MKKHTYVICAYGESPYLEACIRSVKVQEKRSELLIATSTPNGHIFHLGEKYGIPVRVNEGEKGITQDWNFAYSQAVTPYVTIAHQDDIYLKGYSRRILAAGRAAREPLILFTGYGELRGREVVFSNTLLRIKKLMLFPLQFPAAWNSRFLRRRILSLGSPIPCPAVTFYKPNLPEKIFQRGFQSNEDWEAWELLSRRKGAFVYLKAPGMYHRIHEDSETSRIIENHQRGREDLEMFSKFWPLPIARLLAKAYGSSEKSNRLS